MCILITAITSAVVGAVAWCARGAYDMYSNRDLISKIVSVQSVLDEAFLYDYDKDKVADYAALGMTMALDDPYTVYYDKQQFQSYMDSGEGDFVGVGVTVIWNKDNDSIEVISVLEDSPGMEAGILPGDIITAVEGTPYSGSQMNEAVAKIRGLDLDGDVENTSVAITIKRGDKEMDVTLVRKRIHQDTVSYNMVDDNIGYIKITSFNTASETGAKSTDEEFMAAFEDLKNQGMEKLIIDLRDNGGGMLEVVSEIIDFIVPEGLIMYAQDRNGHKEELLSDANELNMPIAVLVNGNSASASELLTGALKDYGKAKIIGTKTFGKGVMQVVYPFSDGSGMTVTIAKYYTPLGTCVQDEGITPDIIVELPEELNSTYASSIKPEDDTQRKAAIDYLKNQK